MSSTMTIKRKIWEKMFVCYNYLSEITKMNGLFLNKTFQI